MSRRALVVPVVLVGLALGSAAQATLWYEFPVVADTWIADSAAFGADPDTNYGDATIVRALGWERVIEPWYYHWEDVYMAFDVPAHDWTSARLRVYSTGVYDPWLTNYWGTNPVNYEGVNASVFTGQPWDEHTLTWNNRPGLGTAFCGLSWNIDPLPAASLPAMYEVGLSGYLQSTRFDPGGLFTVRIASLCTNDRGMAFFTTKEYGTGAYKAKLVLGTNEELPGAVPEPTSIALLALATGGIGATLRKRRKR